MANTVLQKLQAAKTACVDLLLLVTQQINNPTQASIDTVATALNNGTGGPYVPRPNYSLDGESYDWPGYQLMLTEQIDRLNTLIQREAMPFIVRSRARP